MSEFVTIKENVQAEITEKKSKFIANIIKVENKNEAEKNILKLKKKYFDAKHNCIAYRIKEDQGVIEKSSDDGEPQGTAGQPILNILQKNNLCNILVVVTRYFGGILLGTGGLVRAYSEATTKALEKSIRVKNILGIKMEVILEYNEYEKFKYYCKINEINIQNVKYEENIVCNITLEEKTKEKLISDFEIKNIKIKNLKEFDKTYIEKSIIK